MRNHGTLGCAGRTPARSMQVMGGLCSPKPCPLLPQICTSCSLNVAAQAGQDDLLAPQRGNQGMWAHGPMLAPGRRCLRLGASPWEKPAMDAGLILGRLRFARCSLWDQRSWALQVGHAAGRPQSRKLCLLQAVPFTCDRRVTPLLRRCASQSAARPALYVEGSRVDPWPACGDRQKGKCHPAAGTRPPPVA